ncbi:hypothetical protein Z517_00121 [Fonsecaea pedrosoi CBS 271.37]|uniref:Cytochrome P450 n=1 Tax=Fonsecaea pedrosoi CBS 271.37 TaxID=1442368 RepID=A0A0D2GUR4_9EURO|nr:uncharacterized protein Z517_00121 [Fonsecaea pedrosoi CBS 271.37]KIW84733.1 hypothetical protein Z517_00121 [Fonsecaea pedrosoi CBS 271.37]
MVQPIFGLLDTKRLPFLLCALVTIYLTIKLVQIIRTTISARRRYREIPQLPRHPVWGHLVNMGEKLNPALKRHPDYAFEEIWESLGRPPAYLMDLLPVDTVFLIVADPDIAEQITQPNSVFKYSLPKSDTLMSMYRLIGLESLIIAEGEEWKVLRRRFNKGFSPQHLHTLDGLIVSKTRDFIDRLKQAAASGEVFSLKDYSQDLTTDIITTVAIEKDYHAQTTPEGVGSKGPFGLLTASRLLSKLVYPVGRGFNPLVYFDPIRPTKSWFYEQVFNRNLAKVIREQLAAEQKQVQESDKSVANDNSQSGSQRSITRLALSGLTPDEALIRNTVSQIKSFLFAGQDTTATLIQWLCFELSKASWSPSAAAILEKLIEEHDSVFGKEGGPFNALDILGRTDEESRKETEAILGSRLPYTTAFIKETLRLHPPASTARRIPEVSPENPTPVMLKLRTTSGEEKEVEVNGVRIYVCGYLVHLNKKVWGEDAAVFRPDRWLDEKYVASLPTGAWRPFERGPRNCIGQELAMVEAKVVLCAVARGFQWEKVGYSGKAQKVDMDRPRGDGKDDGEREVWSVNQVTSVPVDGMTMKVQLRR